MAVSLNRSERGRRKQDSSVAFLCYLVQHEVNSTLPPHVPMTISRGPYYHELNPVTLSPKAKLFTL